MKIEISNHTIERAEERGASREEIIDVVNTGFTIDVKYNKFGKAKVYEYNKTRNNKFYKQKRIEVIYVIENDIIITITIYVFYGEWES